MERERRFTKVMHTCDLCHKQTHGFFEMELGELIPLLTICKECNDLLAHERALLPQETYKFTVEFESVGATKMDAYKKLQRILHKLPIEYKTVGLR